MTSAPNAAEIVGLPEFVLSEERVANQTPATTYSAPVSFLRFEPQIDLQTRNFGEAQGDISIRGGIFEGTAVQLGGMTIFDPQTGHYAAELPVPMEMLGAPVVRTGADHAWTSLQATAGTVDYPWRRIEAGGVVTAAFGNGDLNRESIYAGEVVLDDPGRHRRVGVDASWSRSSANGTIANGDHDFQRVGARVQLETRLGRTEIFGGYQDKFFGWPNLYTPFGWPETERLQTTLFTVAHRQQIGEGAFEAGAHYRRNEDDYDVDRTRPGLFNPYQHTTRVSGGFASYRVSAGAWRLTVRGDVAADSLDSTSLTAGRFMSRTYLKVGAVAERDYEVDSGVVSARVGSTWDDTNRDASAFSPVLSVSWAGNDGLLGAAPRVYAEFSQATRVAGYTALNSSPVGGLFRGNPDLGREKSRNAEIGGELRAETWSARLSVFHRADDPLVDWTWSAAAPNARTANEVAIGTTGIELLATRRFAALDVVAGYGWLRKDADYHATDVTASFYALNFPIHRATLAIIARLGGGLELRCDNEYRVQEENALRDRGGDTAFLTSVGLTWTVPAWESVEVSLVVDNLWQDDFQEIPRVPAPGRQVALGVAYHW